MVEVRNFFKMGKLSSKDNGKMIYIWALEHMNSKRDTRKLETMQIIYQVFLYILKILYFSKRIIKKRLLKFIL